MGAKNVILVTDPYLASHHQGLKVALESLHAQGLSVTVYDEVVVEPTKGSMEAAAEFSTKSDVDFFVSFGGGSSWIQPK